MPEPTASVPSFFSPPLHASIMRITRPAVVCRTALCTHGRASETWQDHCAANDAERTLRR
eukprot:scaffold20238_cov65-Phaeocystis_antarctica.AAC.5